MRFDHRLPLLSAALAATLVAGCKTAPSSSTTAQPASIAANQAPPPNAATKAAATKGNLAIEKVRLTELFKGTPVVFGLLPDGSLRADVPLPFSFDAGKSAVKPPLAAVLDRIAGGQRDELTRVVISAPSDAGTKGTTLPVERAASVRAYLVAHGLVDTRLSVVSAMASATTVRLIVTDAPLP
jgi:outer membrane protein OmpA-like peptidoglycan-associated protein